MRNKIAIVMWALVLIGLLNWMSVLDQRHASAQDRGPVPPLATPAVTTYLVSNELPVTPGGLGYQVNYSRDLDIDDRVIVVAVDRHFKVVGVTHQIQNDGYSAIRLVFLVGIRQPEREQENGAEILPK
ncbi:MAG: hypothetical protein ABIP75_05565 [Pyrinomonadaceae bacterium]